GKVPIDDPRLTPGENAHQHHDDDSHRHGVLLKREDRIEAADSDDDLHHHHERDDDEDRQQGFRYSKLAENGHRDLDRKIGVHPDPAQRHQKHKQARKIRAPAAEGGAAKHHLIDPGLVAHHRERGEDGAAEDVADHDDGDGLPQPELED